MPQSIPFLTSGEITSDMHTISSWPLLVISQELKVKNLISCFICLYLIGERMDGSDRLQYVELMESIPIQTRKLINHREFRLATCAGITLYKIALTFIYNFRHVASTESHCCLVSYPSDLLN